MRTALFTVLVVAVPSAASAQVQFAETFGRDGTSLVARVPHSGPGLSAPRPCTSVSDGAWSLMSVPPGVYIRAVSMGTPQVGFAAAELGIVLRTTDGGSTWQSILNQGFPYYWYGVHAFNAQTAIITGFNNSAFTGVMRWTEDGGATWGPVQTVATNALSPIPWFYFVNFADANHGIIQMAIGTMHTTNGGRTVGDWTFVAPTNNWFLGPSTFLPDLRVWMTGYDNFRSPNGGISWTPLPRANPTFDGPHGFLPDNRGYIGGGSISPTVAGWLYNSNNGGDSWSTGPILLPPYPVRAVHIQDDRAWVVGGNHFSAVGGIWSTPDNGFNWTLDQNTAAELVDIQKVQVSPTSADLYAVGMVSQIWRRRITTTASCYPNCDSSSGSPLLTPNDFQCFLDRFAAGASYANCDGTGGLTGNDFQCFLNAFAAGCS